MCFAYEFVDSYSDKQQHGRSRLKYLTICKNGRPGHPCSRLRTLELPIRSISYGRPKSPHSRSKTRYITPPRSPSSGSPRTPRLSRGESSDEAARRATEVHRDANTHQFNRRTHRGKRQNPQERIDYSPKPDNSPTAFNDSIYYSRDRAVGRAVVVNEGPVRRLPRAPTPFTVKEKPWVSERFTSHSGSRDRERSGSQRYSPRTRYEYDPPRRRSVDRFVYEQRGRPTTYSGYGSSDNERRGRRFSRHDPETWDRQDKMSPFLHPVGKVVVGKKRVEGISSLSGLKKDKGRETWVIYSDPVKESRSEHRKKRAHISDHEGEHRHGRSSSAGQLRESHKANRRSYTHETKREPKGRQLSPTSVFKSRRESAYPYLDKKPRREERVSYSSDPGEEIVRDHRYRPDHEEPRREERIYYSSDPDKAPVRARKDRRLTTTDSMRNDRRVRRERRATLPEYDRIDAFDALRPLRRQSTGGVPEAESVVRSDIHSSYSDPGDRNEDRRRRRREAREHKAYRDSEREKAALFAARNKEIQERPMQLKSCLKPTVPGVNDGVRNEDGDKEVKAVTITDDVVDVDAALEKRQEDRAAQRRRLRKRLGSVEEDSGRRRERETVVYDDGIHSLYDTS